MLSEFTFLLKNARLSQWQLTSPEGVEPSPSRINLFTLPTPNSKQDDHVLEDHFLYFSAAQVLPVESHGQHLLSSSFHFHIPSALIVVLDTHLPPGIGITLGCTTAISAPGQMQKKKKTQVTDSRLRGC
jgi:hypothetical protein